MAQYPSNLLLNSDARYWIDVSQSNGADGWSMPFVGSSLIVGRDPAASLCLDHDTVSRQHAELYRDPFNRIWIRDLGSRNGVKVNSHKVVEQQINADDKIRLGKFCLQLRVESKTSPAEPPAVAPILPATEELEISTFDSTRGSLIAVEHLAAILSLGERLAQLEDAAARSKQTCDLLLGGEAAWILRVEKNRPDRPQMLFGPFLAGDARSRALHVSSTVLREVVRTSSAQMASNDPSGPSLTISLPADVRTMAAAACPITIKDDAIELLYVIYPAKRALPEWLALTSLVANQFAQSEALWRARRDLEARAVIEHDLKQASRIQRRLLPAKTDVPNLDITVSFEPCRWIGGDYVDVVPLDDGRVLFTIADACGKGMQAALVASWMHTMVRSGTRAGVGLRALVDSMNEHLRAYLPDGSFVTCFAMILDPSTGNFEYANAGHPPAIQFSSNSGISQLGLGTMPLGLDGESALVTPGNLAHGDLLLLYTDGWTDVSGDDGLPIGLSQFGKTLEDVWKRSPAGSTAEFVRSASHALSRHVGLSSFADDRTFLAVRRR